MNSALMTPCGTLDLLRSLCDYIITNGLSSFTHLKGGVALECNPPMHTWEGVTNELKSHPLVLGSWNYAWWHCLSESERDAYPIDSLSLATCVIENLPERALKVTPRYTYDPTTSIGL